MPGDYIGGSHVRTDWSSEPVAIRVWYIFACKPESAKSIHKPHSGTANRSNEKRVATKQEAASGASDPMAISLAPFERQFLDFGQACREGRAPACSGADGYRALQLVRSIYTACAEERKVNLSAENLETVPLT